MGTCAYVLYWKEKMKIKAIYSVDDRTFVKNYIVESCSQCPFFSGIPNDASCDLIKHSRFSYAAVYQKIDPACPFIKQGGDQIGIL